MWALSWTGACLGIWLLTLSSVSPQEYGVGTACALLCGAVAAPLQRILAVSVRTSAGWLRAPLVLPFNVVMDAFSLLFSALRRPSVEGVLREVDIGAAGGGAAATSRRAFATLLLTSTPGTVVVDSDPDTGRLTVHDMASRGSLVERVLEER
jgi:multisubunit Na+/H+ antiporter MnhE subunit